MGCPDLEAFLQLNRRPQKVCLFFLHKSVCHYYSCITLLFIDQTHFLLVVNLCIFLSFLFIRQCYLCVTPLCHHWSYCKTNRDVTLKQIAKCGFGPWTFVGATSVPQLLRASPPHPTCMATTSRHTTQNRERHASPSSSANERHFESRLAGSYFVCGEERVLPLATFFIYLFLLMVLFLYVSSGNASDCLRSTRYPRPLMKIN